MYIDVSDDGPWDIRSATFRDKVTALAAPIHGKPKDQLAGDDLREQRRFRRLRTAAFAVMAVLAIIAVVAALLGLVQRHEALRQRNQAIALRLDAEAGSMLSGAESGGDIRAFQELLAAAAVNVASDPGPLLSAAAMRSNTLTVKWSTAIKQVLRSRSAPMGVASPPGGTGCTSQMSILASG